MYTKAISQLFSNRSVLRLISQVLVLILILNLSACHCKKSVKGNMAGIGLEIPKTLLIGHETEIETIFRIDGSETEAVKLKVSMREQRSLTGSTNGSQISYKDASGNQQTFSDSFEKLLSEFTDLAKLSVDKGLSEFKVNFGLVSASEAIKVKLHFELLDGSDKSIRSIDVEWIKSEIVVRTPSEFKEREAYFTLLSLKEDIKDLNKFSLSIQNLHKHVSFLIGGIKRTDATLAELLPGTSVIAKDQETSPIKIVLDALHDDEDLFSILVFANESNKSLLGSEKGTWVASQVNASIQQDLEELKAIKKEEGLNEQELGYLQGLEKMLEEEAKQIDNQLKEEEEELKEKRVDALKKLKEKEKEELKGKSKTEQEAIKQNYKKQKREVLLASGAQFIKNRLRYTRGFGNSLSHNILGTTLKESTSYHYSQGQLSGHKFSVALAGTEAAIGSGLIGVGVFVAIVGTVPSVGTIETVTIPTLIVGGALVGHGVIVSMRAQGNLAKAQGGPASTPQGIPGEYIKLVEKLKDYRERNKAKKISRSPKSY